MATTLRQQLMIKRWLRQLRTWAPPISIGVIVGAGAFVIAERLDAPAPPQPAALVALPTPASQSHQMVRYANCDAARAAGAAPIHRGRPGYEARLDADRDGVACEPYPR